MTTARNPIQILKEAKQIAREHGCFVVEKPSPKGTRYLVYRVLPHRNAYLGARKKINHLHSFICKVTNFH